MDKLCEQKTRIVILGGGFGGIYTAMYLEKLIKKHEPIEIVLINKENYFVYQPMLAEVVGGAVGLIDTVSSIRRLLPKTTLVIRDIESIDVTGKSITLAPRYSHKALDLKFDHLVLAIGNVTDFRGMPGLHEHALPFKNLADSIAIRNHVIDVIEAASIEKDPLLKQSLLTFVIGGGGFSGTEVAAEVNDFVRKLIKSYKEIDPHMVRVILVHSKDRLMDRELSESLGIYSGAILTKRGVEIRFNKHLTSATPHEAIIDGNERIACQTIISTVPSSPNPLIEKLPLSQEKGRIKTNHFMQVEGQSCIWALGDCAAIPSFDETSICPPTAQFALREGKTLAHNIIATLRGTSQLPFKFKALGMLGALGHHCAVAEILGVFKFSGFFAWLLWRAIYWTKLPGVTRKIKVLVSWLLDTIIPIEAVQLKMDSNQAITKLHFEKDEIIFHEGDIGDYLYIIVSGQVEVLKSKDGNLIRITTLGSGEYFGEMAIINEKTRSATIRCLTAVDALALKKTDFGALMANLDELRESFKKTEKLRSEQIDPCK